MNEGMQPPPIIWSLSSHNIQSKPPIKSSLYYLSAIDLDNFTCRFSHAPLSFIIVPQLFCKNLPNHHPALQPEMEGQFESRLSAALADRSHTQHQGGAASITPSEFVKSPIANPIWNKNKSHDGSSKFIYMGPVNLHMELYNQISNSIKW